MTDPIRPEDVAREKNAQLPDGVIDAFNELIARHYVNGRSSFRQRDVTDLLEERGVVSSREEIFERGLLHVEAVYQGAGWNVEYDKPGWNESYPAVFTFTWRRET